MPYNSMNLKVDLSIRLNILPPSVLILVGVIAIVAFIALMIYELVSASSTTQTTYAPTWLCPRGHTDSYDPYICAGVDLRNYGVDGEIEEPIVFSLGPLLPLHSYVDFGIVFNTAAEIDRERHFTATFSYVLYGEDDTKPIEKINKASLSGICPGIPGAKCTYLAFSSKEGISSPYYRLEITEFLIEIHDNTLQNVNSVLGEAHLALTTKTSSFGAYEVTLRALFPVVSLGFLLFLATVISARFVPPVSQTPRIQRWAEIVTAVAPIFVSPLSLFQIYTGTIELELIQAVLECGYYAVLVFAIMHMAAYVLEKLTTDQTNDTELISKRMEVHGTGSRFLKNCGRCCIKKAPANVTNSGYYRSVPTKSATNVGFNGSQEPLLSNRAAGIYDDLEIDETNNNTNYETVIGSINEEEEESSEDSVPVTSGSTNTASTTSILTVDPSIPTNQPYVPVAVMTPTVYGDQNMPSPIAVTDLKHQKGFDLPVVESKKVQKSIQHKRKIDLNIHIILSCLLFVCLFATDISECVSTYKPHISSATVTIVLASLLSIVGIACIIKIIIIIIKLSKAVRSKTSASQSIHNNMSYYGKLATLSKRMIIFFICACTILCIIIIGAVVNGIRNDVHLTVDFFSAGCMFFTWVMSFFLLPKLIQVP